LKVIYVLMWICIATIGFILFKYRRDNKFNRIMAISLFITACGSFSVSMRVSIIPFLDWLFVLDSSTENTLIALSLVPMILYFYSLPYFILLTGLHFNAWIVERIQMSKAAIVLAIPPLIAIGYQLIYLSLTDLHTSINRYWAPAYLIASVLLYVMGSIHEREPALKKHKNRIAFVFGIAIVWAGVTDFWDIYLIEAGFDAFQMHSRGLWQYNVLIIAWIIVLFLYYSIRYGFLGIKLRIEQDKYNFSMRALTMGTSILNHTLKGEIQKIDYLTERAAKSVAAGKESAAINAMHTVYEVTDQMMDMVERIKLLADDIVLKERQQSINEVVKAAVLRLQPVLMERNIELKLQMDKAIILSFDELHVGEALRHVLMNAIEAMPEEGGGIDVCLFEMKKQTVLEIRDNGVAIPKRNLSRVIEPFFTTKSNPTNYGLGLSYCYTVMQKHGGSIKFASSPKSGTTVTLSFPSRLKQPHRSKSG
jgi:two-component system sporulation sensor kinase B